MAGFASRLEKMTKRVKNAVDPGKQKKPSSELNFFQNYYKHLKYLDSEYSAKAQKIIKLPIDKQIKALGSEIVARLSCFNKIRDGHDYFDEIGGATIVPLLALSFSIVEFCSAIYEAGVALAIHYKWMKDDGEEHSDNALKSLMYSCMAFIAAAASFVNSVLALPCRLVSTAVQGGFAKQDTERFYDKSSGMIAEILSTEDNTENGLTL